MNLRPDPYFLAVLAAGLTVCGCRSVTGHRQAADRAAAGHIARAQERALGRSEPMRIDSPADTLRRRLLLDELLPHASPASLGTRDLPATRLWDPAKHLDPAAPRSVPVIDEPVSLVQALRIAAGNSREFQSAKEAVYTAALDLDLEADAFRLTFAGMLSGEYEQDRGDVDAEPPATPGAGAETDEATAATSTSAEGNGVVELLQGAGTLGVTRTFRNGVELSCRLMVDIVKLLTQDAASSVGLMADASVTIPLLRGAGRDIAAEPLRQAEQNLLYAVHTFERFKRTFAVEVGSDYLSVLQDRQEIANAAENYKRLVSAGRRARRLADAGRLPEFQLDQAVQDELRARTRWIEARQRYASNLDAFKVKLGLPPDAPLELDAGELDRLQAMADRFAPAEDDAASPDAAVPPADAPVTLRAPDRAQAGPLEIAPERAIRLALASRLDLRTAQGQVADAQRKVYVAADALRAELTLLGSVQAGERRTGAGGAGRPDAELDPNEGLFSGLVNLDLPLERTAERIAYRKNLIALDAAVRELQETEDRIKLSVRNDLRSLLRVRENVLIQLEAVELARKRVHSTDLFLQSGRAEIRDVLESEEALLNAQNALIDAVVNYRINELSLQRDMGLLQVDADGLWTEFDPDAVDEEEPEDAAAQGRRRDQDDIGE